MQFHPQTGTHATLAPAHTHDGDRAQGHQLIGSNGALVCDDSSLGAYLAQPPPKNGPALYFQAPENPHPAITAAEEVSFVPHPKTMTMAGEWEYFAAGSQHPFPFAIAELIDNSLRATRGNAAARHIVVSLVTSSAADAGVLAVWDNGCGMTLRQLSEWAVMNLTMEDRGIQPQEAARPRQTQAAVSAKQLCSDLSYFGVGSKNAAFFMGRSIQLISKSADNVLVHELTLSADALEQRYKVAPDQVCVSRRFLPRAVSLSSLSLVHRLSDQAERGPLRPPSRGYRCTRSRSTSGCPAPRRRRCRQTPHSQSSQSGCALSHHALSQPTRSRASSSHT